MKEMTICDLVVLTLHPITRRIKRAYYTWAESHFLMCAESEADLANQHSKNVGYFQRRAALARSLKVNS